MVVLAQDQGELFDVMPEPENGQHGVITNPPSILFEPNCLLTSGEMKFKTITRRDAHKTGTWHRAIGIWLYNDSGEVLVQRRSTEKDSHPLKWQSSAAGHVTCGDSVVDTVIKEVFEETGLVINTHDLELVTVILEAEEHENVKFGKMSDNEYRYVFISRTDKRLEDCNFNVHEVCELKFMPYKKVLDHIESRDPEFCPLSVDHISLVRAALDAKNLG